MTAYVDSSAGDHGLRDPHSQEASAHRAAFGMDPGDLLRPMEDMGGG